MKVTVIPIVISTLGTLTKGLIQGLEDLEIRGQMETIRTIALLRVLRRVLDTWGNFLPFKLQWETIAYRWCEKLEKDYNNDNEEYAQPRIRPGEWDTKISVILWHK